MDTIVLPPVAKGTTSKIIHFTLGDSSATSGAGIPNITFGTSSFTCYFIRPGDAAATQITMQAQTIGTWATGGFIQVAATNMKGVYEFGVPNACLATGAEYCILEFRGATGVRDTAVIIPLIDAPATATELAKVPKTGQTNTYQNTLSLETATVAIT